MKLPDDVRQLLLCRFQNKRREWLMAIDSESRWPLEILLGAPTEQAALRHIEGVRTWVRTWQHWQGAGALSWCERRWQALGVQRLPDKLILQNPEEVAHWIGESARFERARSRYQILTSRWPTLALHLPRHFDVLADYDEADFRRLGEILGWIDANPHSGLYPRQLPIAGIDSKWIEGRKGLLTDLVAALQEDRATELNFYQRCGLKAPPPLVRMRVLDQALRTRIGGMSDISAPVEDLANLDFPVAHVFIVENLQTGLAMSDLPDTVVFMGMGYHVEALTRLPWIARALCLYWGDLDTHGFAILQRARAYLPGLQSVLMDQDTLLSHKALWVSEKTQHPATELPLLTASEQQVYRGIKQQQWGQNIRLEQERIDWGIAWKSLRNSISHAMSGEEPPTLRSG